MAPITRDDGVDYISVENAADTDVMTEIHPSLAAAIGTQCGLCGSALAGDQRYCVQCGERRGASSLPAKDTALLRASHLPDPYPPARRPRVSANATLIAGVGTLLLAMGIGVLIGRSGTSSPAKSPPVQVISVGGGGGAASATTPTTAAATPSTAGKATQSAPIPKGLTAAPPTKIGSVTVKGLLKPKKVLPPPKNVTVGTPGHGPGYQKGKFTGNFFGTP